MKDHPDSQARTASPTLQDKLHEFYLTKLRGRKDFSFMTRGITSPHELLIVGPLNYVQNQMVMTPRLVIGSDRLELYEFFGRRKEVWTQ